MEFDLFNRNNMIFKQVESIEYPLVLQVEITDKCNFNCKFCYNDSERNNKNNLLEKEEFNAFLNEVFKTGGVFCWIISGGEPLLYKEKLIHFLSTINEDNSAMVLITNGYLLDEKFVKSIEKYNWYWVQVSIDSSVAEIHNKMRGMNDSYEKAIKAVQLLRKENINTVISSVITDENIDDIENIVKLAIQLGANGILFSDAKKVGRAAHNKSVDFSSESHVKYINTINKCVQKYGKEIMIKSAQLGHTTSNLESMPMGFLIRPNGDVKIDCLSNSIEGNIFVDGYLGVWKKIRKGAEKNE